MLPPEDLIRLHHERIERALRGRQVIRHAEAARRRRQVPLSFALRRGLVAVSRWLAGPQRRAGQTPTVPTIPSGLPARPPLAGSPAHPRISR